MKSFIKKKNKKVAACVHITTRFGDHDVVIVAIPDTQDVGGHAVTATGIQELLHSLLELHADKRRVCYAINTVLPDLHHALAVLTDVLDS